MQSCLPQLIDKRVDHIGKTADDKHQWNEENEAGHSNDDGDNGWRVSENP
ncbi:hypothetical protein SAMN02927900_03518 [Rhizobium mongolense subsp. loessense]|uniref:Uncharacterized protein n=1 Tax=Rhizobium mongolense subsp. loessense TaxID=158890 RepID=A0A1G4SAA4_9HYPH|nr:hypothetical protein SAMN02927900_03518 [Rhizobium mongolense subsp. loessense]